ncbi:2-isopropylmalate synthase [Micromonospora sp. PLK6-60]|uniref:2-isopropylmalate synthase n=1 Tax=Micromonospora sp. PLK6-60 TaxID=2873383 RepID=UPI001CA662A2|nr:2-isopropylmalate synthase [Micromonospora sp. PLK6-60]MBY8870799.1 2-isopropylmalate synthase [Micromonospora sp. PLK6-60]
MDSYRRYAPFRRIELPDRTWPDRTLTQAPRWLSTDLRDGNQALVEPMCPSRKLRMFELLTSMGYREIEVGFPAASQDETEFVRMLIEQDRIPDDVRITVGVPARAELIEHTVKSLRGARRATVCVFNATAPASRSMVFKVDREQCRDLAVQGARWVVQHAERLLGDCDFGFEYTPEMFNETEMDFALEVCEAVMDVWQPGPGRETVLNLPSTVERSGPHMFADQIEWMDRQLSRREHICLSVHPHNDRGTAVAAAELAMVAGADRIEGCLFGNGERTGNVCLVTLGLNLFSQGIDPRIDFSDMARIRAVTEYCTRIPVHPRHPYGGDLVYTAFAGSHQDAINKGLTALAREASAQGRRPEEAAWTVPYLPIDPKDIGRSYESIVRVNSQSGKGGVAYVLRSRHDLTLPYGLQVDFAHLVQGHSEATGDEIEPAQLWRLFESAYLEPVGAGASVTAATLYVDWRNRQVDEVTSAEQARVVEAVLAAQGIDVLAAHVVESAPSGHPGSDDDDLPFAVYAECRVEGEERPVWGVGLDPDIVAAAVAATRSAVGRARPDDSVVPESWYPPADLAARAAAKVDA